MVREYEVYKHFNGTVIIDPCMNDTLHSYGVGEITIKSSAGLSHYNVLSDFIDGYFLWKNMYRVNSPFGSFTLHYTDYEKACSENPDSRVTYLWQEVEFMGAKLYRNINPEMDRLLK